MTKWELHMKKLKALPISIFALSTILAIPCASQAFELEQVSARAGTLGAGAELGIEVLPTLVLRGVVQGYDYNYNRKIDGIKYDGKLSMGSYGLQADFHPPLIPLYLTAGVYANDINVELTALPTCSYTIGNHTYTAAEVGTLNSKADFNKTALYGGLGLEFQVGPLAAVLEGGVYYQGKPDLKYNATGLLADNSAFKDDLALEMSEVKDKLDKAEFWPAVTLMARWKF